ncbi:MAG: hypothetical protein JWR80_7636 [Bradyrhizobium sp.]|nr:hypothetical protein [Bradyrhizobium sp.]
MNNRYPRCATFLVAAVLAGAAPAAAAPAGSSISVEEARAIIAPLYEALNEPARRDVERLLKETTSPDFTSCAGSSDCINRDAAILRFKALGEVVPDLHWVVRDVLVTGNQIIVRGEASGTPVKPFLGVAPTGKSFTVMSIDIHSVRDGRVVRTYHVESWAAALRQLTAK